MSVRGPYAKGIAKREEILDVALELFAQKGYDRVSVREVARASGLSQAGLLHHFSTKEDLFLGVLRRRDDRDGDPIAHRHEHNVRHLIGAVEHNATEPGLVRLFVSMSAESIEEDSLAHEFFIDRYGWLRDEVATDVRIHQRRGELSNSLDPDDVASILIALADGIQLQWLLEPGKIDMGALMRSLWDALRRIE